MDRSRSLHRNRSNRIWQEVQTVLAALLLGGSSFAWILKAFGLSFTFSNAFQGGIGPGMVYAWNQIADKLGNEEFLILKKYEGGGEACGLFLLLTLILILVVTWFSIRSRFLPVLLLFILPQLFIGLFFSLYPSAGIVILHAISVIFAVIIMRRKDGLAAAAVTSVFLALILGLLLVISGNTKNDFLSGSGKESALVGSVRDLFYGSDDLGHGDLTRRKRSLREGEALQVSMSRPQSMYLKGFTGSVFTGQKWEESPDAVCYQNKEMLDALEAEGFHCAGQLAQAASLGAEESGTENNEIQIVNTGADRRYVFVPYDMTEAGTLSGIVKKGGDLFFGGGKSFQNYRYTASDNQVEQWTDVASRFFIKALNSAKKTEETDDYLRLESYFNRFVYETCTALSKSERLLLAQEAGDPGDQSEGHLSYRNAIEKVRSFLEDNFIYSEDLGERSSKGYNELKEFFESGKGYDVQYATAATLLFRYYGIPARYAEGYLITPEDAENASSDGMISVPRARSHAWTEIYIDGTGFVPLEVTPEFYGVMKEADLEKGISNEALIREYEEQQRGLKGEAEEPLVPEENTNTDNAAGKIILIVFLVLVGIAVLLLVIWILSRLIKRGRQKQRRNRLFQKGAPKTAVAAIYDCMEVEKLDPDPEIIYLGNLAAYSRAEVTEKDRQRMLDALKQLRQEKRKNRNIKKQEKSS